MQNQFKLTMGIGLIWLIVLLSLSGVSAEVYKWKDRDGNIFYSDSPPPSGMDGEVKRVKEEPKTTERPKPKISSPQSQNETAKENRSYSNIHVIMYMTSW